MTGSVGGTDALGAGVATEGEGATAATVAEGTGALALAAISDVACLELDTSHATPTTATPSATAPPRTMAATRLGERAGPVRAAWDLLSTTGWPVVGTPGANAPTAVASVRLGTVSGTVSRGAVLSGAPVRS